MIFQWRGANDIWASHSRGTSRRVEVTLHQIKYVKETGDNVQSLEETECCPRTVTVHETATWNTMTCTTLDGTPRRLGRDL